MYIKLVLVICTASVLGSVNGDYFTPSAEVGRRVAKFDPKVSRGYPFELGLGIYYQGDIMLAPTEKTRVSVSERYASRFWPGGRVPYEILGSFDEAQLKTIQEGMDMYKEHTCIRFVPKTDADTSWIKFLNNDTGCYSYVGRQRNNQYNLINLQTPTCLYAVGPPVHEMMHAIGFYHEFTRPDRDDWISLNKSALVDELQEESDFNANFGKLDPNEVDLYGIAYNYGSVMHYSKYAGARSADYPVMNNKKPWDGDFGNEKGFAASDIESINIRYKCSKKKKSAGGKQKKQKLNKLKASKSE
ncbi:astacin-like [Uranotaenia lowii]|uniref:astacin-like n=1 Tax=Uranotaenia lowii TaxID=190385 RepID=UPI00247A7173|nr:astacin-like [Uranotaenia lowii]